VEHHTRECMPQIAHAEQLAAEVITPAGETSSSILAMFLSSNRIADNRTRILAVPADVESKLAERLPGYMVPTILFVLPNLPMTTTDKIDRRRLREIGASYSAQQLADLRSQTQGEKRMPSTEIENKLQQLCSQVLNISSASIGMDDSFFRLGGNSIAAMKLVAQARNVDLQLSVADIFKHPLLCDLSQRVVVGSANSNRDVPAFSLVGSMSGTPDDLGTALAGHGLDVQLIEDAYPCTPLQEALLSVTTRKPGHYVLQTVLHLSPDIDLNRFRASWERTVQSCPILRTRILYHQNYGLLQMAIKEDINWLETESLEDHLRRANETPVELGQPLTRYSLICDPTTQNSQFVWTIHHALFDGVSMSLVLDLLHNIYQGNQPKNRLEYKYFMRYALDKRDTVAETYWRLELA
ncbi:hypothetical protein B5807_12186, partial [Epicoccum nigrum]